MVEAADVPRDLSSLVVPRCGSMEKTDDLFEPYRLVDAAGGVVAGYLRDLQAGGRSASTQRSYGMDLLRWFRFLWATEVSWDRATRLNVRISAVGFRPATSRSGRIGGVPVRIRRRLSGRFRLRVAGEPETVRSVPVGCGR